MLEMRSRLPTSRTNPTMNWSKVNAAVQSRTVQILAPLAGVAIATIIRFWFHPYVGQLFPFFSYFLVVILCALYGGAVPGAIALFAGYLAGRYYFVMPTGSFLPESTDDLFGTAFYFMNGSVMIILAERQRTARMEAKEQAARSEASERLLQESIQEVEILNQRLQRAMSETHHRVKNNLQVISAMVDMQTMQESDSVPKHEFTMIANHIRGLAAIHDLLTQQSRTGGEVDSIIVEHAFEKLMPTLQTIAGGRRLRYDAEGVRVPIRQGAAIIVAVNELVSNAVKHGAGEIDVAVTAINGNGRMTVSDRGRGFPDGFSPTSASAGLNLVSQLIHWDLRGQIAYKNRSEGGAQVEVTFPLIANSESAHGIAGVQDTEHSNVYHDAVASTSA